MMMCLHEIIDRKVVLPIVQPRSASDDLLELDHGIDRAHQDDVADIAGIHAGREFLRGRQDRRDALFVVLEVAEVLPVFPGRNHALSWGVCVALR
jgi:hypothetical protein